MTVRSRQDRIGCQVTSRQDRVLPIWRNGLPTTQVSILSNKVLQDYIKTMPAALTSNSPGVARG